MSASGHGDESPSLPARLKMTSWLETASTYAVMAALNSEGAEARFVGGAVRNSLLGEDVSDIDIASTTEPSDTLARLRRAGIKTLPTGIAHGTVTAITPERHFEITTLRRDVQTDGRRAKVVYGSNWEEDARRRDFTFNALYADKNGTLYDPLNGYADVMAKRICFIGDARTRIREDYLRILRFFRFHAIYGGVFDTTALEACIAERDGLLTLSGERMRQELFRLLLAQNVIRALEVMMEAGILRVILPEATMMTRLSGLTGLQRNAGALPDALLRFGALITDDARARQTVAARFKLSNSERERLLAMTSPTKLEEVFSPQDGRRMIYEAGVQAYKDRLALAWAEDKTGKSSSHWRELAALAQEWEIPRFPISGADLKEFGVSEGPRMGTLLAIIESEWIAGDFMQDRATLLDIIKKHLQSGR